MSSRNVKSLFDARKLPQGPRCWLIPRIRAMFAGALCRVAYEPGSSSVYA